MTRTYRLAFRTPACHAIAGVTRETVVVQATNTTEAVAEAKKSIHHWAHFDRVQTVSCPTCGKMSRDDRGCAKHKVTA